MNVKKAIGLILLSSFLLSCKGENGINGGETPDKEFEITITPKDLSFEGTLSTANIKVSANDDWTITSDDSWITYNPQKGYNGETSVRIEASSNPSKTARTGILLFSIGTKTLEYKITQNAREEENYVPEGYSLVWNDEFDSGDRPGAEWSYETGGGGWGNNELQHYVNVMKDKEQLAVVKDGILSIIAKKIDGTVYSIRMNTTKSWTYGYFEARLKLPVGKGTWPAFWMMPKNFNSWPDDGEIDIMEHVGYRANWISSSVHCKAYYHSIGTQKTSEKYISTAQSDFHVYAVEWTEDYIKGFVDGVNYFTFTNDKAGDYDTWPFFNPFYLKLNLAWGGNWGGAQGVDESLLPATYQIDYVRVFQKTEK